MFVFVFVCVGEGRLPTPPPDGALESRGAKKGQPHTHGRVGGVRLVAPETMISSSDSYSKEKEKKLLMIRKEEKEEKKEKKTERESERKREREQGTDQDH